MQHFSGKTEIVVQKPCDVARVNKQGIRMGIKLNVDPKSGKKSCIGFWPLRGQHNEVYEVVSTTNIMLLCLWPVESLQLFFGFYQLLREISDHSSFVHLHHLVTDRLCNQRVGDNSQWVAARNLFHTAHSNLIQWWHKMYWLVEL